MYVLEDKDLVVLDKDEIEKNRWYVKTGGAMIQLPVTVKTSGGTDLKMYMTVAMDKVDLSWRK